MNVAILGHGLEGQSAEKYFQTHGANVTVFDPFQGTDEEVAKLQDFDLVMRSPSIPPRGQWSSGTKYFFEKCPCLIIGVTGTKGKGTTCSLIASVLEALGQKVWLVGNIGKPALDVLDQIQKDDVVVYEMSSFQLWDMDKSPHIAVVLHIEPDHLNIHKNYEEYIDSKSHIAIFQNTDDTCVYYAKDEESRAIADKSAGHKLSYPIEQNRELVDQMLTHLSIVGPHNRDNAEAALLAAAAYYGQPLTDFIGQNQDQIAQGLHDFHGLPHRLEFLRELNGVEYYDDNFSTNVASTAVALQSFPNQPIILIAGGRDKTDNEDLPELNQVLQDTPNLKKLILIGESGHDFYKDFAPTNAELQETLLDAITAAKNTAETMTNTNTKPIVLMSPAAASFDMFDNVYDRGAKFQKLIRGLK